MITMRYNENGCWPTCDCVSQGGIRIHGECDDQCWLQQGYLSGLPKYPPHYPVPALLVDSCSDLGMRWSNWLDTDASYGIRR